MNEQTHQSHHYTQGQNPCVLPPHAAPHSPSASPERRGLACHSIGLIDKQLDTFTSGQNLLHVLHHDILDLSKLSLGTSKLVRRWVGVVLSHKLGDHWSEGTLESICRWVG